MKKLLLLAAVAVFGLSNVNAQEFSVGLTAGIPVGDAGDFYTFNLGLDANYLWEVSDDFSAGVATGYNTSFGDDFSTPDVTIAGITIPGFTYELDNFDYIPLAAAGRFNASEEFVLGADLGYAIVLTDGVDGGFYYRPMVGYNVSDKIQISVSYRGVSNDGSFSTINAGVNYKL